MTTNARALAAGQSCTELPPRLWRHFGCGRWDCGDLGGFYDGCRGTTSGRECHPPLWNCSAAIGWSQPQGAFACVGGEWADMLPLCLGSTAPEDPGGTWRDASMEVRAVLFKLNISWSSPVDYRLDVCTRTLEGELGAPCTRTTFGQLLERNLWALVVQPLQDALCDPALEQVEPPNMIGIGQCTGALSSLGDRVHIAGVRGSVPEGSDGVPDKGSLVLFLDAVPARGGRAEGLRDDVVAAVGAMQGVAVNGMRVSAFAESDDVSSGGFGAAEWLLRGLSRLKSQPQGFNIRQDGGFKNIDWFPAVQIDCSEPYIINRRVVPHWRFWSSGPAAPDPNFEMILRLRSVQDVAVRSICALFASVLIALVLLRFLVWPVLFGKKRPWQFVHTLRAVNSLAVLADVIELLAVGLMMVLCSLLAAEGVLDRIQAADFRHPLVGLVLLPLPIFIVLPSLLLTLTLMRPGGDLRLPRRSHFCGCWRLGRQGFRRLLLAVTAWHALVALLISVLAAWRLAGGAAGVSLGARSAAVAVCEADLARSCGGGEFRQLDSFSHEHRAYCAQDCNAVLTPASDVLSEFETLAYCLGLTLGLWSLLVHLVLLFVSRSLGDPALQAAAPGSNRGGGKAAAAAAAAAAADKVYADGKLSLADSSPEDRQPAPTGEAMLTPQMFEAGVMAAEEQQRREEEEEREREKQRKLELEQECLHQQEFEERRRSMTSLPAPLLLPTPEASSLPVPGSKPAALTTSGDEAMRRVLAAISAVEGDGEVEDVAPTVGGPMSARSAGSARSARSARSGGLAELFASAAGRVVAASSSGAAGGGGGALARIVAGDEKELLDFAQFVAKSCSRDSFGSGDSARSLGAAPSAAADDARSDGALSARSNSSSRSAASSAASTSSQRRKHFTTGGEVPAGQASSSSRSRRKHRGERSSDSERKAEGASAGAKGMEQEEGGKESARSAASDRSSASGKRFVLDW